LPANDVLQDFELNPAWWFTIFTGFVFKHEIPDMSLSGDKQNLKHDSWDRYVDTKRD